MKLHVLRCGCKRLDESAAFGNRVDLKSLRWLREKEDDPGCEMFLYSHDANVKPQVIEG